MAKPESEEADMPKLVEIEAYCVRCIDKKIMRDPIESLTKNGKVITKGICPDCGLTICRFGSIAKRQKSS